MITYRKHINRGQFPGVMGVGSKEPGQTAIFSCSFSLLMNMIGCVPILFYFHAAKVSVSLLSVLYQYSSKVRRLYTEGPIQRQNFMVRGSLNINQSDPMN
jgi:hypothetical protein